MAEENIKDATWRNAGLLRFRQDVWITEFLHFLEIIRDFVAPKIDSLEVFLSGKFVNQHLLSLITVSEAPPLDMAEGHSCRSEVPWR